MLGQVKKILKKISIFLTLRVNKKEICFPLSYLILFHHLPPLLPIIVNKSFRFNYMSNGVYKCKKTNYAPLYDLVF